MVHSYMNIVGVPTLSQTFEDQAFYVMMVNPSDHFVFCESRTMTYDEDVDPFDYDSFQLPKNWVVVCRY